MPKGPRSKIALDWARPAAVAAEGGLLVPSGPFEPRSLSEPRPRVPKLLRAILALREERDCLAFAEKHGLLGVDRNLRPTDGRRPERVEDVLRASEILGATLGLWAALSPRTVAKRDLRHLAKDLEDAGFYDLRLEDRGEALILMSIKERAGAEAMLRLAVNGLLAEHAGPPELVEAADGGIPAFRLRAKTPFGAALLQIGELLEFDRDEDPRARRCGDCGRWFLVVANARGDKWCSPRCRVRGHRARR